MEELLKRLATISHEISKGNYGEIEQIFELTRSAEYPASIAELAEAFGMMIVKVEARELKLESVIEDLKEKKLALEKAASELAGANINMLEVLGNAIAKRDSDTNEHNYRVTFYAVALAKKLGIEEAGIRSIVKGSCLHDVGKIAIPDRILLKPGKLTTEEFEIMKTHVIHGCDIIEDYEWLADALDIVSNHHEKFDGTGYMKGLQGEAIPIGARIFAIADVFDALTSERPYKGALPFDKTLEIMKQDRGSHFDPDIFDNFHQIAECEYSMINGAGEKSLRAEFSRIITGYFQYENSLPGGNREYGSN